MERHHLSTSRASAAAHRRAVRRRAALDDAQAATNARAWFALHRCPACGSAQVRRSRIRSREAGAHAFRSPYRCEACRLRFWVVSRRTRMGAAAGAVVAVFLVAFAAAWSLLPRYTVAAVDHDIEEWSAPPPLEFAGAVLTPRGMAAGALAPNENLASPVITERSLRSVFEGH
jgi:predicted RNA-binding Zn-ribbon protein involved in translation (DUF1610 family)